MSSTLFAEIIILGTLSWQERNPATLWLWCLEESLTVWRAQSQLSGSLFAVWVFPVEVPAILKQTQTTSALPCEWLNPECLLLLSFGVVSHTSVGKCNRQDEKFWHPPKDVSKEDNRKTGKEATSKEIEVEKFPEVINMYLWIPEV